MAPIQTGRYQGPFDQSGRPMQQQFNPTGYVPHGFFGGGRAGLNRQQLNRTMQQGPYGNALGGFKNQSQPVYRGNDANQPITGLPNVSGMNLQQMRQSNYGTQNAGQSPVGQGFGNAGMAVAPQQSTPQMSQSPGVQTGGGFPVSEAGSSVRGTAGGITGGATGIDPNTVANSAQGNDGGYDGSGINPNGMYSDPMTDPNFDPAAAFDGTKTNNDSVEIGEGSGFDPQRDLGTPNLEEQSALADIDVGAESGGTGDGGRGVVAGAGGRSSGGFPATGLSGYEQAVGGGTMDAITALDAGQGRGVQSLLNAYRGGVDPVTGERKEGSRDYDIRMTDTALNTLNPYTTGGAGAVNMQAALSGALGADAQARAFADFQESPGQKYLRDQTERGVLRNAAALGGVGGGNVMKALQANAMGLAAQDFQNQFDRLGTVANRGMGVAGTQAGLQAGIGARQAEMRNMMGSRIADMQNQAGRDAAGMLYGSGLNIGDQRMQTGRDIAANIDATTQRLAALQGGEQLANLLGGNTAQISNLIIAAQNGDAQANQVLSEMIANMAVGAGSSAAARSAIPGVQELQGGVNRFLSALG